MTYGIFILVSILALILHEERVENGHIKRQHIDVQFVLRHKIVDEFSQRHFTAIVLHSSHIKSIPEGPLDIVVLCVCVCVCIGVHVYSRNIRRGIKYYIASTKITHFQSKQLNLYNYLKHQNNNNTHTHTHTHTALHTFPAMNTCS